MNNKQIPITIDIETVPPLAKRPVEDQLAYTRELLAKDILLKRGNRREDTYEAMKEEIYTSDDLVYEQWKKLSLNVYFARIACIGIKVGPQETKIFFKHEFNKFYNYIINQHQAVSIYVGHNISKFDMPIIYHNFMRYALSPPEYLFPRPPYPNYPKMMFDFIWVFPALSLKQLSYMLELDYNDTIDGSQVLEAWQNNDVGLIDEHCRNDVEREYSIYKKLNLEFDHDTNP